MGLSSRGLTMRSSRSRFAARLNSSVRRHKQPRSDVLDQQAHERDLEFLRATVATARTALTTAMLINAGAAIAVLAFLGNLLQTKATALIPQFATALILYVVGVLVAAVATGTAYISQAGFGQELGRRSRTIGELFRYTSMTFIAASYVLFGCASWSAYAVLTPAA